MSPEATVIPGYGNQPSGRFYLMAVHSNKYISLKRKEQTEVKTLENLYNEIIGNDELQEAFAEAAREGTLEDFLKAHDCEATAAEAEAFLKEKQNQKGELSDNELEDVAGGCRSGSPKWSSYTEGTHCAEDPSYYPPG